MEDLHFQEEKEDSNFQEKLITLVKETEGLRIVLMKQSKTSREFYYWKADKTISESFFTPEDALKDFIEKAAKNAHTFFR